MFETVIKSAAGEGKKKDPKAIWDDDEVDDVLAIDEDEDRPSPEYVFSESLLSKLMLRFVSLTGLKLCTNKTSTPRMRI